MINYGFVVMLRKQAQIWVSSEVVSICAILVQVASKIAMNFHVQQYWRMLIH